MIKVFKNEKNIYAKAYKYCDIIGVLRPHRDFWNNAYVQENFIEGLDIIYVAVTPDGYIAFPKEMPFIWQTMIEEKANEYANDHFVYMDSSYKTTRPLSTSTNPHASQPCKAQNVMVVYTLYILPAFFNTANPSGKDTVWKRRLSNGETARESGFPDWS